jgi:hypothetical protein
MAAVIFALDLRNRGHVNMYHIDSLMYWCEQFGCKSQVRDAVREIGTSADALRNDLQGYRRSRSNVAPPV